MNFEYLEQFRRDREELYKKYDDLEGGFPAEFITKCEELKAELNEESKKKYLHDAPNGVCNHALISGILIENNFKGEVLMLTQFDLA